MRPVLLAVLLACCASRSEFEPVGTLSETLPAAGVRSVAVSAGTGAILFETREGETISVEASVTARRGRAVRGADRARDVRIALDGGALRISDGHLGAGDAADWSVSFLVKAPPRLAVALSAATGSLALRGTPGAVEARTGAGNIDLRGDFEAVTLVAGTGAIRLEAGSLAGGRATSGVGDLFVRVARAGPTGDFAAETGTGSVAIHVPADYAGRVSLQTAVGAIDAGEKIRVPREGSGSTLLWQIDPERLEPGLWAKAGVGDILFRRGS